MLLFYLKIIGLDTTIKHKIKEKFYFFLFIEPEEEAECYMADRGEDYRGDVNVTETGLTCQAWNVTSVHTHRFTYLAEEGNACRNPDGEPRPWCYTMDRNKRFEFCDVHPCSTFACCFFLFFFFGSE